MEKLDKNDISKYNKLYDDLIDEMNEIVKKLYTIAKNKKCNDTNDDTDDDTDDTDDIIIDKYKEAPYNFNSLFENEDKNVSTTEKIKNQINKKHTCTHRTIKLLRSLECAEDIKILEKSWSNNV